LVPLRPFEIRVLSIETFESEPPEQEMGNERERETLSDRDEKSEI
jgi:hypothetical protein